MTITDPQGYSIFSYGAMISQGPRAAAYAEALRRAITPGCTVFDIGAGTGFFSILACQYGAGKVIAIEPDKAIGLLGDTARANSCADRIEVIRGLSTDYSPASKADVIISDLRGALPLYEGNIPSIVDARERLLSPGGTLLPMRDTIKVALACDAEASRYRQTPWLENQFGLDLSAGYRFVANHKSKARAKPGQLLSSPQVLGVVDYLSIVDPNLNETVSLTAEEAGTAHGLLLWFDTELCEGVGFSNAPTDGETSVYGQTFLPLEMPVALLEGDRIDLRIRANLVEGNYVWSWDSSVFRQGAATPVTQFSQSTFLGELFSPEALQRRSDNYVPPASQVHALDIFCLSRFDGQHSLRQIASELAAGFPDQFPTAKAALDHVAALAGRY